MKLFCLILLLTMVGCAKPEAPPVYRQPHWVKAYLCYDEANGGFEMTREPCERPLGQADDVNELLRQLGEMEKK